MTWTGLKFLYTLTSIVNAQDSLLGFLYWAAEWYYRLQNWSQYLKQVPFKYLPLLSSTRPVKECDTRGSETYMSKAELHYQFSKIQDGAP